MQIMACYLLFLSVVTLELANRYVSTVTSTPSLSEEVPSTHMPHILSNPTEVSVSEGQNVTFHCSVDELGDFAIIWMKNTEVFFLGLNDLKKDPRITIREDMSVHIKDVHKSDAANYTCQISTTPTLEVRHTLTVKSAPSAKTIPKSGSLTVKLGDPIKIGCDTSGNPPPTVTWTHSMKEVTEFANDGEIFIPEAKKEHAGIYECKVDNGMGIPALGEIEVNVHYKPYIEVPMKVHYTGLESSIEISCSIFGEPLPTVTWLKDNTRILVSQDYLKAKSIIYTKVGNTHTLRIRNVRRNDLGIYTCKAINRLGSASETIEVTGVPAPVEFKYGVNNNQLDSYAMMWSVKSHSPIIEFRLKFRVKPENGEEGYEWTEVPIPAENNPALVQTHTYEITGLEPASVYEAVIFSRNEFGWNNRSEIFTFKTEGGVIGVEDEVDTVLETNEPNENMVKTSEVTSSSVTATRTTTDGAAQCLWTGQLVTLLYIVAMFLW